MDNDVKLGRFISLILRHKPETINLKLDKNGWADTKELIEKISKSGREIDFETLERIVNEKIPSTKVGEERVAEIQQLENNYRHKSTMQEDIFIEVDGKSIENFNFDEQEVYMVTGNDLQVSSEIDILKVLDDCYLTRNTIIREEKCIDLIIDEVNRLLSTYFSKSLK